MLRGVICDIFNELYMAESKQFIDNVHHTHALDFANRVDDLSWELIANEGYRRNGDAAENCNNYSKPLGTSKVKYQESHGNCSWNT